jgi:hypothetical protein
VKRRDAPPLPRLIALHGTGVAADRLARTANDAPMVEEEVLQVLARIARTGKPGDGLRAAELIGKQLGMFREEAHRGPTLEMVLEAGRLRRSRLLAARGINVPAENAIVDGVEPAMNRHKKTGNSAVRAQRRGVHGRTRMRHAWAAAGPVNSRPGSF